jgi:hypothetical protein
MASVNAFRVFQRQKPLNSAHFAISELF